MATTVGRGPSRSWTATASTRSVREGTLTCYRVTDGEIVWQIDTQKRFGVVQNFFGVGSTPLVEGDLLLVQVGGSPPGSDRVPFEQLESNGTALVAFDKRSGKVKYETADELASYASPIVADVAGRRWCFLFARGGLLGLDPANGTERFRFPWRAKILESVNASTPVVAGDRVFISETYGPGSALLKVGDDGYEVVWADEEKSRRKALQTHWNTAVQHDGYLYASSGRHTSDAELRCIELETGEVQWSQPGMGRASMLYVDGHLVCLAEYGELYLLEATPEAFRVVDAAVPVDPMPVCRAAPAAAIGLPSVGRSDFVARTALCPRQRPPGVHGIDPAAELSGATLSDHVECTETSCSNA